MSYIQLPNGHVRNNKQVQFNLPSNYEESQYYKEVQNFKICKLEKEKESY